MKKIITVLIAAALVPVLSADTGAEIMGRVIDSQKSGTRAIEMTMTLMDKGETAGQRTIQTLVMNADGLTKTVTLFLSPAFVKNTRFLTIENRGREDDQWIYLPALGKVKRIAAGERSGSFMGTDFTYADMASITLSADEADHRLLREEVLNGRTCWVVESIPPAGGSEYGRTVTWVDKENYLTLKVDFYDRGGTGPVKFLTSENPQFIDGHWTAMRMTMTTQKGGHSTVIQITRVKFDMPLDSGYFTEYFLETGRPQ